MVDEETDSSFVVLPAMPEILDVGAAVDISLPNEVFSICVVIYFLGSRSSLCFLSQSLMRVLRASQLATCSNSRSTTRGVVFTLSVSSVLVVWA